jgi:biotin carboxyl carrier protein
MKPTNEKVNQEIKYLACGCAEKPFEFVFNKKGIKINRSYQDIKISEENGLIYIYWKNKNYVGEIIEKCQNKYTVMLNGVTYFFTIETPFSYERKKILDKTSAKSKKQAIAAPMPGKIVEVLAEENSTIKEGEPVFILEAMKMQNEILSHISGKITKINVKQNDVVVKGDILIEIQ